MSLRYTGLGGKWLLCGAVCLCSNDARFTEKFSRVSVDHLVGRFAFAVRGRPALDPCTSK